MAEPTASELNERINQHRDALSRTLGTLASDVSTQVKGTAAEIQRSVQHVTAAVEGTVAELGQKLSLPANVQKRPMTCLAASAGLGILLGRALARRGARADRPPRPHVVMPARPLGIGELAKILATVALEAAVKSYVGSATRSLAER